MSKQSRRRTWRRRPFPPPPRRRPRQHRADWPFADDRGRRGSTPGPPLAATGTAATAARPAASFGGRRPGGRGGPGGPWGGRGFGGPRRSRGDVRLAILALLAIEPMHGYQMIQEISERSGGRWEPSPGSVYPTLQALEDEGLVIADQSEGKRVFDADRPAGREQVESLGDRAKAPWDLGSDTAVGARALAEQMRQLAGAFTQVLQHRLGRPARPGPDGAGRRPPGALPDPGRRPGPRPTPTEADGTAPPEVATGRSRPATSGVEVQSARWQGELGHAELPATAASHSGRTTAATAMGWSRPEPCTAMRTNSTA